MSQGLRSGPRHRVHGGSSFCTIVDLYVQTVLSRVDQQVLRALQTALGMDGTIFRLLMGASSSSAASACQCDARTCDATERYVPNGAKKTMEHVVQSFLESSIMIPLNGII